MSNVVKCNFLIFAIELIKVKNDGSLAKKTLIDRTFV
jgi:hypothetical protein